MSLAELLSAGAAVFGMGFYLGVQFTGRIATAAWPVTESPSWISTAQTAGNVALGIFAVGAVAVVALDYHSQTGETA
jgi:hypothetical protein